MERFRRQAKIMQKIDFRVKNRRIYAILHPFCVFPRFLKKNH